MTIDERRRRIDELDAQLLERLSQRAAHVIEIARLKRDAGADVHQPDREQQVLQRIVEANPGPMPDDMVTRLFRAIIDESKRLQRGE